MTGRGARHATTTAGRACAFTLDARPDQDKYTLVYDWDGRTSVRWQLVEGKMLKAKEGAYALAATPTGPMSTTGSRWT